MTARECQDRLVIDYACQFVGNPYVWGGTSLTNGADCSGFVQSVYAYFGISLPRTTYDMVNSGYAVSYDEAQPGDLILYGDCSHVGLYMGDGNIVNALNSEKGICICSATYTNIYAIRTRALIQIYSTKRRYIIIRTGRLYFTENAVFPFSTYKSIK